MCLWVFFPWQPEFTLPHFLRKHAVCIKLLIFWNTVYLVSESLEDGDMARTFFWATVSSDRELLCAEASNDSLSQQWCEQSQLLYAICVSELNLQKWDPVHMSFPLLMDENIKAKSVWSTRCFLCQEGSKTACQTKLFSLMRGDCF